MKNFLHEAFLQRTDRPDPNDPPRSSFAGLAFGAVAKPLSWIYRAAVAIDRRVRYPQPIDLSGQSLLVVVASPVVGGVGKTPLVAHIALQLAGQGHDTKIVSTGYGRHSRGFVSIGDHLADVSASEIGDEALMLWQTTGLPVHVGVDPAAAVARLDSTGGPQCIVLDDGVRRRWKRERRIVVFSAHDLERPVRFLPDGRWRIAPHHAWPAAGVAILEDETTTIGRGERKFESRKTHQQALERWGYHGPVGWYHTMASGFSQLGEKDLRSSATVPDNHPYVFSGLGRPSRFLNQVRSLPMTPAGVKRFPDHHRYSKDDLRTLESLCRESESRWLLTTHKDAVKIDPAWVESTPIFFLRISLESAAGADMLSVILEPPE